MNTHSWPHCPQENFKKRKNSPINQTKACNAKQELAFLWEQIFFTTFSNSEHCMSAEHNADNFSLGAYIYIYYYYYIYYSHQQRYAMFSSLTHFLRWKYMPSSQGNFLKCLFYKIIRCLINFFKCSSCSYVHEFTVGG